MEEDMLITATIKSDNQEVITLILPDKVFSTGSKGFHKSEKITINNKRYQLNFMLIEIGSRPNPEND
jgi:hypothetical protein